MEHASKLDLTTFEDPLFYDKMERARVQGTDRLVMIQSTGMLIQQLVTTISMAGGIIFLSPWILLVLIACVVPAFMGETHFAFKGYSLNFKQTPAKREMEYLRIVGGSKESAKELKLFGLANYLVGRYSKLSNRIARGKRGSGEAAAAGRDGVHDAERAGVLRQLRVRDLQDGDGVAGHRHVLFYGRRDCAGEFEHPVGVHDVFDDRRSGDVHHRPAGLFQSEAARFLEAECAAGAAADSAGIRIPECFVYLSGADAAGFEQRELHLRPTERIALVGENGQGKTTIVKLLTRLYDPTGGRILLDGVDLREYDLEDLWKETGVIFQDFVRYDMTASENIAIGRIEEQDNTFRVRSAAQKSLAEGVIRKLPNGYNQILGRRFEGGTDLSGGEWQKIALARAYLRDAQVLVLDEPTAALDARSEHEVFERFAELTKGKMALLISHRFSTVKMADRILGSGRRTDRRAGPPR